MLRNSVTVTSDEQYHRLLEISPFAIAIHREGTLVYVNPAAVQLMRAASAVDLVGHSILEFVHPDFRAIVSERVRQVHEEGRTAELLAERFVRHDGQVIEVEVVSIPVIYAGEPAAQVILRDVTAQNQAVRSLEREEEHLRLIVQASDTLLGSLDRQAILAKILDLAQRHVAADAYAVWRKLPDTGAWDTVASAGLQENYRQAATRAMNHSVAMPDAPLVVEDLDREPLLARHRQIHRLYGTQSLLVVPLRIHHAQAGTLAFYYHEPHHFTKSEVRVATALANMAGAAITFSELYDEQASLRAEAERAIEVRERVLALVSHDLKNAMVSIRGSSQLLRRYLARSADLDPGRFERGLGLIEGGTVRILSMVNNLLDITRARAGQPLDLQLQETDLVALVNQVVSEYQQVNETHRLLVEAPPTGVGGQWDAGRLERMMSNLLANAVKYSPNGGDVAVQIGIESKLGKQWAVISVRDAGIGISDEDLPHIFEPFRRGQNAHGQVSGAGLGLASVHEIVIQHGGTIDVTSAEGRGSTFTVCLPLEQ